MHWGLRTFGIITSIGMLIVLLQGALVTNTGSGEGCGATWPLCFGEVVPSNPAVATIIEYSHRLWSGLMGLFVIILAIWSSVKLSHLRETKFMALMAVLFIIFQGLMGAGAVIWGNSSLVLALHFGISAISLATVIMLTVLAFEDNPKPALQPKVTKGYRSYLIATIVYSYAVIYTGAYVKHSGGSEMAGWIHRGAAVALMVVVAVLMIWTLKRFRAYTSLAAMSVMTFVLILVQAGAGIALLLGAPHLTSVLIHALTISIIFTIMTYMLVIITRRPAVSSTELTNSSNSIQQKEAGLHH